MKNITRIMLTWLFLSALLCLQAQIPDLDTKYATEMLKHGLAVCHQRGMDEVIVGCLKDNKASEAKGLTMGR